MTKIQPTVLVADPDARMRRFLTSGLELENYLATDAADGTEALRLATLKSVDLIILEPALPDMDGSEVLERVRAWSNVPVLILSARTNVEEKVRLFGLGADDYVTKPFSMEELLARTKALLRRSAQQTFGSNVLEIDRLKLNFSSRSVFVDNVQVKVRPKEYLFLQMLAQHPGCVIDQRELLTRIWGPEHVADVQYLRVIANRLRNIIEGEPSHPKILLTELGVGYRLAPPTVASQIDVDPLQKMT
jgi:two-component system KDP operon response regulator KdpE